MTFFRTASKSRSSFRSDASGTVGIIFGLSFIPTMLVMGVALDYRNAVTLRSRLQAAVDSASLAVAASDPSLTQTARQQIAQNIVAAKLGPAADRYAVAVTETEPSNNRYQVSAVGTVSTTVMRFAHFDNISVSASSTASAATTMAGGGGCVLSLDDSAVNSIWYNGHADVVLHNCNIYGNSASSQALDVSGSANLWANMISVHGHVQGESKIVATQGVLEGQPRTLDPYADVPLPAFSGCDHTNYATSTDDHLQPGVYCNGFAVNSTAEVELDPGLYVIDGGAFKINGQAELKGEKVTIVFTSSSGGNWPTMTINGGAQVNLKAPNAQDAAATGGIAGIVFYGDRAMPAGQSFKLNGGSTQTLTGAVYLPEAAVTFAGGASPTGNCTHLIGNTLTFIGDSDIGIDGCGNLGVRPFGATRTVRVYQ
ncbi:TadE/TadG family type IV pilus assembly protein [Methylocystis parvus]|uniref:TadE/TadG family type IV pilus assembly protein n=1 Tax=Methylocystis parvus TaxID=134 RepID=UPI003C76FC55